MTTECEGFGWGPETGRMTDVPAVAKSEPDVSITQGVSLASGPTAGSKTLGRSLQSGVLLQSFQGKRPASLHHVQREAPEFLCS
jgi:hypothetical protein